MSDQTPQAAAEHKPWTRWWWMGNALTEAEVTRHLELFDAAGFGGVEVSPIYGPRGAEERFVLFLSPRWVDLFTHTLREAKRLGMGVDLIAGTGWPFGGPWVAEEDKPQVAWVEAFAPGEEIQHRRKTDQAVEILAVSEEGNHRYALFLAPTGQQVKRAAPGGEGHVLDHFDAAAVRRYFDVLGKAFNEASSTRTDGELVPRCFFNDSWEVFGANATPTILDEFERRRGYDLRDHLHHLSGDESDPDTTVRVRSDYRKTIHDLTAGVFLETFADWARGRGSGIRNQSHGSPGNLLDLYGAADIPETELFGPIRLTLGGLERLTDLPPDFDAEEEALLCRMASSAAHVAGRPLCSSEAFTWLGDHGHVPLDHMKAEVDTLFALGINHLFYHGTPFSPADAEWPGWMFYASTHVAPTNPLWRDLSALNAYIARCQAPLQAGSPDSDVLLYLPFHDLLAAEAGGRDLLQFMSFHRTETWLRGSLPDFCSTARALTARGYAYDLVSDAQLREAVSVESGGGLVAGGGGVRYRVVLVAGCRITPPETMERLAEMAQAGAVVLVQGALPEDVPGLADVDARRARLRAATDALKASGRMRMGSDATALLAAAGVPREPMADQGLEFLRRRTDDGGRVYFVANPGREDVRGWVPLAHPASSVKITDPMTGASGAGAVSGDRGAVYLDLPAGASLLLQMGGPAATKTGPWSYAETAGEGVQIADGWRVTFVEGGPSLPETRPVPALSDWTSWGEASLQDFSGTARYTVTFDAPDTSADAWTIDLGRVCHAARVRLNGRDLGAVIARPWRIAVPDGLLLSTGNTLEIEVTNLMANRLAAREREVGDAWRPFLMVNIRYKTFDPASWPPVPSGLIGPVRLVPLKHIRPQEPSPE